MTGRDLNRDPVAVHGSTVTTLLQQWTPGGHPVLLKVLAVHRTLKLFYVEAAKFGR